MDQNWSCDFFFESHASSIGEIPYSLIMKMLRRRFIRFRGNMCLYKEHAQIQYRVGHGDAAVIQSGLSILFRLAEVFTRIEASGL